VKLSPELLLAVAGVCFHAAAVVIWVTLFKKLERWVWWLIFVGYIILVIHRFDETFHWAFFPNSSHITALLIAIVVLVATIQTRVWVRRRDRTQASLAAFHDQLQEVAAEIAKQQLQNPLSHQIAKLIASLRSEIDYYEKIAKRRGFPLYKDIADRLKNGGQDRTPTG